MAQASNSSGISGSIPVFVRPVTEGGKRAIHLTKTRGRGPTSAALNLLGGQPVRAAVFILHQVLTPDNVNHLYPNHELNDTVNLEQHPSTPKAALDLDRAALTSAARRLWAQPATPFRGRGSL